MVARKIVRKANQRLRHIHRPPAGGAVLAQKVVEHWRQTPQALEPVDLLGIVRPLWITEVLDGTIAPDAATVALVVNLIEANGDRVGLLARSIGRAASFGRRPRTARLRNWPAVRSSG